MHTYVKMYVVARESRLVEKGSLVGFLGPPTHRDEYTHIHLYASHWTVYICMSTMFPSYVLDSIGSVRFLIVFILPPLLVKVACQGYFDEDHFRC